MGLLRICCPGLRRDLEGIEEMGNGEMRRISPFPISSLPFYTTTPIHPYTHTRPPLVLLLAQLDADRKRLPAAADRQLHRIARLVVAEDAAQLAAAGDLRAVHGGDHV